MSSGCFLALWSPLTASFYQVRWFVQSLGHSKVNQSFSNGTFKTRLILVLSLPYRGRTNLSAPLKASGRLTQKLYSRDKCPLWKTCLHTHIQSHMHLCLHIDNTSFSLQEYKHRTMAMFYFSNFILYNISELHFLLSNYFSSKLNSYRTIK